ncbi:Phosphate-import protein PhnD precursor [compost metagenome]
MFKPFITISLSLVLAAGVLTGCGSKKESAAYVPKQLTVQFVPSQNAETLEAKAKPLEGLLTDKLGIPVKVSVSTNYNTIIEAMASKQVDIGFLPPSAYILAHDDKKAADLLLQAQRFGVEDATGKPTTELVDFYKAMIIVKSDSSIKSIKDLKGKKVAWQDVTSAAGYTYPAYMLKKDGIDPDKDVTGITVKGHDKAVLAVLNGEVDAAAIFQDARTIVTKDFPDVFTKTKVLAFSDKIPNDTITVRPDMDKEWQKKVQQAFIDIGKDPKGQQIISDVYSHKGYVASQDKTFDIVRDVNKQLGIK